jgi:N-acetylglucosamine-6-phosphate deacetylase
LQDAGVVISAGHSNASFEQAREFASRGVKTITHLFNAMSPIHHRAPGLPTAVFESPTLMASIIPDGIHVHYSLLRMAKQLMGERLFYITDAVTPTSEGPYQHVLNSDHYALPNGTLSGSSLTMLQAVVNGITHAGIPPEESLRMATEYPAKLLGIDDDYGSIAIGKKAALLLLNEQWELVKVFGF